jgi:hypothetical protein
VQTYRRRTTVQAVRWFPGQTSPFVEERKSDQPYKLLGEVWHHYGTISGRNGFTVVHPGDWVVKSADGELAVCRDDVFRASYEHVNGMPLEPLPPGEEPKA